MFFLFMFLNFFIVTLWVVRYLGLSLYSFESSNFRLLQSSRSFCLKRDRLFEILSTSNLYMIFPIFRQQNENQLHIVKLHLHQKLFSRVLLRFLNDNVFFWTKFSFFLVWKLLVSGFLLFKSLLFPTALLVFIRDALETFCLKIQFPELKHHRLMLDL